MRRPSDMYQFMLINKKLAAILEDASCEFQQIPVKATPLTADELPSAKQYTAQICQILDDVEETKKVDLPAKELYCLEVASFKTGKYPNEQYKPVAKKDWLYLFSLYPSRKKQKQEHSDSSLMDNTMALPDELWLHILKYVQFNSQLQGPSFFAPYALVNKRFKRLHDDLSAKAYELMVFCLVGKEGVDRLITSLSLTKDKWVYLHIFRELISRAKTFAQTTSFEKLETILLVDEFEQYYNAEGNCFAFNDDDKNAVPGLQWIPRDNLLAEFFEINEELKQKLLALTPNKHCHYALMALSYICNQSSSASFKNLACLYGKTGMLRGALFITEFCQGFNLWKKPDPCNSEAESDENDVNDILVEILSSSLRWGDVGEPFARYMMEHYPFNYSLAQMLTIIGNCETITVAVKLLLSDIRHFESSEQILRTIVLTTKLLKHYLANSSPDDETLAKFKAIKKFADSLAEIKIWPEEKEILNQLSNTLIYLVDDEWSCIMIDALAMLIQMLTKKLHNDFSMSSQRLADDGVVEPFEFSEPLDDLEAFFMMPSCLSDIEEDFLAKAADDLQDYLVEVSNLMNP